jgi:hypothetical protein
VKVFPEASGRLVALRVSGTVPFSTQFRIESKIPAGYAPAPPKQ